MLQTKNQELFTSLTLYFAEELYKRSDDKVLDMQKDQKQNRDNLLTEIASILLSYKILDSKLSLTLGDRTKLYSKLGKIVDNTIKKELKNELYIMEEILKDTCLNKYNTNNYIYSLGKNFKLTQVPDKTLDKIINTEIDGEIWSDRLWSNKNETAKDLKLQVKKFLIGDINVNEVEKVIKTKYNANASNTDRLVKTEICRIQESANDYWQHDHNIEYVMYMATLDSHVCEKCAQYDSEVYKLDEKPVKLPQHPHDRCLYVSLVDKNWKANKRYNNQSKQNINWTNYENWSDKQS